MAFRPDKSLLRAELDNTVRGRVTGTLWFAGRADPVTLDLSGDAWADVAGARITLSNPHPQPDNSGPVLSAEQRGRVGDITVSNRRKHFTVPEEEVNRAIREGRLLDLPWVWKNAVYIEWYSERNGRVVIESTEYEVTVSEHLWTTDADDEAAQQVLNMEAMREFLDLIIARPEPDPDPDDGRSADDFTEDEWEESLKYSDRLTDANLEALDKFKDDPDFHQKEAFVMGWDHLHEARAAASEHQPDDGADDDDEEDFHAWMEAREEAPKHPLLSLATAYVHTVMDAYKDLGIEETEPQPVGTPADTFIRSVMQISGKLAGVLSSWHTDRMPRGMILATTRRCLTWANDALTALAQLETTPPGRATPSALAALRPGLFQIRAAITEVRRELQGET